MSLVGFKARNHRQQVGKRGANPFVDDRETTPEVFEPLHERFEFTLDVAASAENAKLPRYFTADDDGLAQPWGGERVWCNPPYSRIEPWCEKAWAEIADDGHGYRPGGAELVVMLLPANRTEQKWWQRWIEPGRRAGTIAVEFLPGRMRFIPPGEDSVAPNSRPPFGCCLVIWPGTQESRRHTEAGQIGLEIADVT
jgi:phage N-6-adenine-methyltransferase